MLLCIRIGGLGDLNEEQPDEPEWLAARRLLFPSIFPDALSAAGSVSATGGIIPRENSQSAMLKVLFLCLPGRDATTAVFRPCTTLEHRVAGFHSRPDKGR
ncbi:hypothetical protein E4U14_007992 [Claviceps sp. LM454 group G7]|nr:hypothetical protein E4U14_007992 [Claviceps sp. LM454 group G7]